MLVLESSRPRVAASKALVTVIQLTSTFHTCLSSSSQRGIYLEIASWVRHEQSSIRHGAIASWVRHEQCSIRHGAVSLSTLGMSSLAPVVVVSRVHSSFHIALHYLLDHKRSSGLNNLDRSDKA